MVCAQDCLEKEKAGLKALTHTLIETRNWMSMFRDTSAAVERQQPKAHIRPGAAIPSNRSASVPVDEEADARRQMMSDLMEIEASLNARKREPIQIDGNEDSRSTADGLETERRRTSRLAYPVGRRPVLSMDDRSIPILDLSPEGMCLEADVDMPHPRIIRGIIDFAGRRAVPITGKVVRTDGLGLGLRLVTRIGRHILDQERLRLNA